MRCNHIPLAAILSMMWWKNAGVFFYGDGRTCELFYGGITCNFCTVVGEHVDYFTVGGERVDFFMLEKRVDLFTVGKCVHLFYSGKTRECLFHSGIFYSRKTCNFSPWKNVHFYTVEKRFIFYSGKNVQFFTVEKHIIFYSGENVQFFYSRKTCNFSW